MALTNGGTRYAVWCDVALEDLVASVEALDDDPRFRRVKSHLANRCASCISRLSIVRDLLQQLMEPGHPIN